MAPSGGTVGGSSQSSLGQQSIIRVRHRLLIALGVVIVLAIVLLSYDGYRRGGNVNDLWQAYSRLAQNSSASPTVATFDSSEVSELKELSSFTTSQLNGLIGQVDDLAQGVQGTGGLQDQTTTTEPEETVTPTCDNGDCVSLQSSSPGATESGSIRVSGTITAGLFSGNGSSLSSLNASHVTAGTLNSSLLSSSVALVSRNDQTFTGNSQLFKNSSDSSDGFAVEDSTGNPLLVVDTAGGMTTVSDLSLTSTLQLGEDGTAISQIRIFTPVLNPDTVSAASTAEEEYAVNGLSTDDTVIVNKPSHTSGCGIVNAVVSADDTLALTWMNADVALDCDPPSELYSIIAIRS